MVAQPWSGTKYDVDRHSRESGNPVTLPVQIGDTGFPIYAFGNDGKELIVIFYAIVNISDALYRSAT